MTDLVVRSARASDAGRVAEILHQEGKKILGTTDPRATAPVLADTGRRGGIEVVVVEHDARVIGAQVMILGDAARHWRRLPLRHPIVAARLARPRLTVLIRRVRRRLDGATGRAEATGPADATETDRSHPAGDDDAGRPAPPSEPSIDPALTSSSAVGGPDSAYTLMIVVESASRGRGAGTALLTESLALCRRRGMTRYHAQIRASAESSAMHLRAGATSTPISAHARMMTIDLTDRTT